MKAAPALASDAQARYLLGLTAPDRLARLSTAEARFLVGWLRGPPGNMSRAQQLYLAGLLSALSQAQVRAAIEYLRGLSEPAAMAPADGGQR